MNLTKPLLWHQGLFLQPQHMQYLDSYHRNYAMALACKTRPYFWGLIELEIDMEALQSGAFQCKRLMGIFPDGALVCFPDNALLNARNFDSIWTDRKQNLPVYLALKRTSTNNANVTLVKNPQEAGVSGTRYVSKSAGVEYADAFQSSGSATLKQMDYVLRLCFGDEKEALDDCVFLPLAELTQEGKEFRLDEHFIPPCINIGASRAINSILLTLKNNLLGRARLLESYKSAGVGDQGGLSGSAVSNRMALATLARYIPLLMHLVDSERVHPSDVYGVIRQLAGELSIFSSKMEISGEGEDGLKVLPYDHDNLSHCFRTALESIGHVLGELTVGPELLVSLKREETNKFVGVLSKEFFDRKHSVYLLLRTRDPFKGFVDAFLNYAKLGATGQVDVYARRALPGINLMHLQGKPIGVTGQANTQYFMIERESYEWGYVQDSGQIGLIWNDAPADLAVDIVLVRG